MELNNANALFVERAILCFDCRYVCIESQRRSRFVNGCGLWCHHHFGATPVSHSTTLGALISSFTTPPIGRIIFIDGYIRLPRRLGQTQYRAFTRPYIDQWCALRRGNHVSYFVIMSIDERVAYILFI